MNKSGLIEALSKKEDLTEKRAIELVNLIFKGFTEELTTVSTVDPIKVYVPLGGARIYAERP
jgi:nucleoid DNA-binding protein